MYPFQLRKRYIKNIRVGENHGGENRGGENRGGEKELRYFEKNLWQFLPFLIRACTLTLST